MDLELNNKAVVVTGASRGIGLATVEAFSREGARVYAISRTATAALKATGATCITADLSTEAGCDAAIAAVTTSGEGIDILVNNVGGGMPDGDLAQDPLDGDDDAWRSMFELNLFAAVRTTRAALPALLASRGAIVNVSSDSARRPHTAPLPYAAAKAALNAHSKGLSEKLGPQGVRVNTVTPAATRTSLWEGEGSFGAGLASSMGVTVDELLQAVPGRNGMLTGRLIEAEEVARVILYLSSPTTGSVVGSNWVIDAGASKSPA